MHARSIPVALLVALSLVWMPAKARADELFRGDSMFGPLVVTESGNVRHLLVGNPPVEQSAIRVGDPTDFIHEYTRLLAHALGAARRLDRVLVIGLGGGVLPTFLHHRFPTVRVDVVEIDPVVVEVAKRFFFLPSDDRIRIHVGDGRAFLDTATERWDAILVDAYAADTVPAQFAGADFVKVARDHLTAFGIVASNVWAPPSPQYEGLLNAHRAVFPHLLLLAPFQGLDNEVLLGRAGDPIDCLGLAGRACTLGLLGSPGPVTTCRAAPR